MKTEDLIALLATDAGAVEAPALGQRYAAAIGWGVLGASLLMLLLLQIRQDLGQAIWLPMFWVKMGFVACLAAGGLFATIRLSRPGAKIDWVPVALGLPVLGIWSIAAVVLMEAEPMERSKLFFGETWKSCPLLIAMLSDKSFWQPFVTVVGGNMPSAHGPRMVAFSSHRLMRRDRTGITRCISV